MLVVPVYVNLFNGSSESVVQMKVKENDQWVAMKKVMEQDPYYVAARQREMMINPDNASPLNPPIPSDHLWKVYLPEGLKPGSYLIQIKGTDAYNREHSGNRIIRVVP